MSKLEELQELSSYLSRRGSNFRCGICNAVSDESIETNIGDYKSSMSFTTDPKDHKHFICVECSEIINDTLADFNYDDD